ncbi:type I-B CRISPR-associated protein Cas8b/Csh1 [Clostridium sporogenes]|uniref:CRISPR-associated protein Cas8b/Csh1, subtype I-B/HMARI n=1 Tax=Clostridium cochlearium TaxID=1494 RepID=A0A2X2Y3H0_CLOCO|nr:type I-B CRISPR-associated protein Cas8b/Csh1 [Clostridium cochlearium]MBU5268920.1 type I-B CRISPR-associated protein Cas8b/Csh1 [Clostridium cochlearium]MCR1970493.1 type I-B CRISPR-associated protein Cas8b/Csh1 [Clostridium cochlearium]SQB33060.1 CRISPR-associated protein Cas8b/Csh1, subtype I-B/HMARI [Clostridium cochlearium]
MLKDVISVFKREYEKIGDSYITHSYIPADGEYIIVDTFENNFKDLGSFIIEKDKKTKEIDITNFYFDFVREADYLSKLLDMNKPIDPKKVIHSNNYLSFFIKKENVNNGKLTDEIIDKYYEILKNPLIKYKNAKAKKLYEEVEEKHGKADHKLIDEIKNWIKNNIHDLVDKDSKEKTYLKIFFKYDLDKYKKESEKYILTNLYNSNDYNISIEDKIHGLPNDNMGLNSKKPYLENKTRKSKVPYLLSKEEVLIQKKFFDYLMNKVSVGKNNIYVNENGIKALSNNEILKGDFTGYYLRIQKGKEVEIHNFDTIVDYNSNIKPFKFENVLELEKTKLEYNIVVNTMEYAKNLINEVFFNKFLTSNYFTEAKDLNINDATLKRSILLSRDALFTWFYKGINNNVWKNLNISSLNLIKGSINNGYLQKASDQFNLRCSLKNYFEGGVSMADVLLEVKNSLREKINKNDTDIIKSDREYYFAVGQLTSYFISLSKGKSKVHSLANPIINGKTDKRIKDELRKLYKRYNYTINVSNKRFKNLFAMVSSYIPEEKVNEDLIIAGYLHSNLIYEKSKNENNEEEVKNEDE